MSQNLSKIIINPFYTFTYKMDSRGELKLFACASGTQFAEELGNSIGKIRGEIYNCQGLKTEQFADGERTIKLSESVRGTDSYIIQQPFDPTSPRSIQDNVWDLLQGIRTLKWAGASYVTAVTPLHPYGRQDKSKGREAIGGELFAEMISQAGASNLLTMDLHADQITGFYDPNKTKIDNLRGSNVLLDYFKREFDEEYIQNLTVVAPDTGGTERAQHYAKRLGADMAMSYKKRSNNANEIDTLELLGEVRDRNVLVIDDMVDTGGTQEKVLDKLAAQSPRDIKVACSHGLFNKDALSKLSKFNLETIVTDTVPRDQDFFLENPFVTQVPVSELFGEAIHNLNYNLSLSPLYLEEGEHL